MKLHNKKICILYKISHTNEFRFKNWFDGFVSAINLLKENNDVDFINMFNIENSFSFDKYDSANSPENNTLFPNHSGSSSHN